MTNYSACLAFTLGQEGGWSDQPHDPGGCTMDGITLATYQSWMHDPNLTPTDLHNITEAQVSGLYQDCFWTPIQGDSLPAGVCLSVFDMATNASVPTSVKLVQSIVGVTMDGIIGPITIAAIKTVSAVTMIDDLATQQANYYRSLNGFVYFGTGWLRRVNLRKSAAIAMATSTAHVVTERVSVHPVSPLDQPPDDFWLGLSKMSHVAVSK